MAGGSAEWRNSELDQLGAWLDGGGSLLALLDPRQAPELAAWLGARGITPLPDVVLDPQNRFYGGEGVSLEAHPPASVLAQLRKTFREVSGAQRCPDPRHEV